MGSTCTDALAPALAVIQVHARYTFGPLPEASQHRSMLAGMTETGTEQLSITVALAYGPTWYTPDWWSQSSHAYDYLDHDSHPYSEMPKTAVTASMDDTLAAVYDRAGEALGIAPGPDAMGSREGT